MKKFNYKFHKNNKFHKDKKNKKNGFKNHFSSYSVVQKIMSDF